MILAQQHTFWGRDNNQKKKIKKISDTFKTSSSLSVPWRLPAQKEKKKVKVINL